MKTFRRLLTILITLTLSLSPLTGAMAKDHAVHPALWKVSSKTATIYLFGTIHALPKGLDWRTPALVKAEAASDRLALELIDADDKGKVLAVVKELAVAPDLPDVLDRVPADKRAIVTAFFKEQGLPPESFKKFKTWAVVLFVMTPIVLKSLDVSPVDGVEPNLRADFTTAKKPLEGLETLRYQLSIFNNLTEAAQRRMLVSAVEDLPKAKADFAKTLNAWETGDPQAIAANFDKDLRGDPEFKRVLLHNRNMNWAEIIADKLKHTGTTLIAVGAGHLAGSDSVIAMLTRRGFKVQRVG